MKKSTHLLIGLMAGAAVGAGMYAFFQSEEGKAWWQKMKEKAAAAKKDLSDLAEITKEDMEENKAQQEA